MRRYYHRNAGIYDATRWAFLYGRRQILWQLPQEEPQVLAEIGCGTGWNLRRLARLQPGWQLIGVDVSPDMLARAERATAPYSEHVRFFEQAYGTPAWRLPEPVDLMLFSYSLTMFNPGWEAAIEQARADLKPGGSIAVVDFHDTPFRWFRYWMDRHRVRMDCHLLPFLEKRFTPVVRQVNTGWGGLWQYFLFVGKK